MQTLQLGCLPAAAAQTMWPNPSPTKGAPARESRTGTRLVSPTPGCEKKKGYLWNKASERKIEYIRNIISIHRYYGEWYNSWKSSKTRKRVKKKTYPWKFFHIWIVFFVMSSVNASYPTNSFSLYQQSIWLKTLFKSHSTCHKFQVLKQTLTI